MSNELELLILKNFNIILIIHSKKHFVFVLKTILVTIFVLNFYPSINLT